MMRSSAQLCRQRRRLPPCCMALSSSLVRTDPTPDGSVPSSIIGTLDLLSSCRFTLRGGGDMIRRRLSSSSSSSSSSTLSNTHRGKGEQLRVAVVGGGVAGLSSALHLAPLVEAGLVASPIDVYTAPSSPAASIRVQTAATRSESSTRGNVREIGVGVWSTALDTFRPSSRPSHQQLYKDLTDRGTWVENVGYRTPVGRWLMTSRLPRGGGGLPSGDMPALLFLRERDLHTALLEAAHWEQHRGTVHVHCDSDKMRVVGLEENSSQPWSARLVLERDQMTSRDYHLIVAADGTHSLLRQRYGGHQDPNDARILTGTAKMGSFLGTTAGASPASLSPSSLSSPNDLPQMSSAWNQLQQEEAVGLQDRNYTVFRGNSPLSASEVGMSVPGSSRGEGGPVSFQTWGEGRNMRFATVPMSYPVGIHRQNQQQHREERQVWFITIDDDRIAAEADPLRRRTLLLEAFQNWHDPIRRIVEATPPESILMERAVAHRHSMAPVLNLNRVLEKTRGRRPPNSGEGPCLAFIGDANMTVDPILAQGFTVAVEGAHELARAVQSACVVPCPHDPTVAFHPQVLRRELQARYESSVERIICLLRATELVQALGQPAGGTISGFLHTMILRPLVWMLPNAIKAPIFDATLKYSLGVLGKNRMKGHQAS